MRLAVFILLVALAGCTAPVKRTPPLPPRPAITRSAAPRMPASIFNPAAERILGKVPFRYGTIPVTNYWWDLQASSNLVNWTTIATDLGPDDVTVSTNNFGQRQFFRMKGRP